MSEWGHFANGTIHVICSSHNDIAWFDTPAQTIQWRDTDAITPAIARMQDNPDVTFCMENVLYLLEYLERHPEQFDALKTLAQAGRFDWGATYNQPYEGLLSGEGLVRTVLYGRRLIGELFGTDARVYYSPDVPGRAAQMAQILAKSGVPYLVHSRYRAALQHWYSPDGSRVTAWSMGHYVNTSTFAKQLDGTVEEVRARIRADLQQWDAYYRTHGIPNHYAYLYSMDYIPPHDFDDLIAAWAALDDPDAPSLVYSTPERFLDAISAGDPALEQISGERPDLWVYIHGPAHHHAITAKREAAKLLPVAEAFATFAATHGLQPYPARRLREAWLNAIYDDHGWGGNNGHITDESFRRRLVKAQESARAMQESALHAIAAQVRSEHAQPLVIFNGLSWTRTELVRATVSGRYGAFGLVDADGQPVAHQMIPAGNGVDSEIVFAAADVPSLGYTTYGITETPVSQAVPDGVTLRIGDGDTAYENAFYRVTFGDGGLASLVDKQLDRELLNVRKFRGAEVFMLESTGYGAHDFGAITPPSMLGEFERAGQYPTAWRIEESGPIYTTFAFTQQMRHCLLYQEVICYHGLKRIDFDITLINFDGTMSREFRLALPLNTPQAEIAYHVPMGVSVVGQSEIAGHGGDTPVYDGMSPEWGARRIGPTYSTPHRDIHPREVGHFISASADDFGLTLTTPVAAFDYIDPTRTPDLGPIIQPILLASRKSNHPKGNWYLQAGDHRYRFSLTTHAPGWTHGWRDGLSAAHPLPAVTGIDPMPPGDLPARQSLVQVDAQNVLVTTLKQAEDSGGFVIRCVEMTGQPTEATFTCALPFARVQQVDMMEGRVLADIPASDGQFTAQIGAHAIETFLLRGE